LRILVIIITAIIVVLHANLLAACLRIKGFLKEAESGLRKNRFHLLLMKRADRSRFVRICFICFCSAVILFGAIILVSYVPRNFQRDFLGLEILLTDNDRIEIVREVSIRIDGKTHGGLFSDRLRRFMGAFEINVFEQTVGTNAYFDFNDYGGSLLYSSAKWDHALFGSLGVVHWDKKLSSFVIIAIGEIDPRHDGENPYPSRHRAIVAPAHDLSDALEVLNANGVLWDSFGFNRPIIVDGR